MKWLLISLAFGLATSDKLDRTYLPPPGAQFAGGILGNHDAPLEPPHHTHSGPGTVIGGHEGSQPNFGINGEPVKFGDKTPKVPFNYSPEKVPITTTSYAFSQTTTYPSAEGFGTTALLINPVTGLPVQQEQGNYPYGPSQEQQSIQNLPGYTQNQANYGTNIQPGFAPEGPISAPINFGNSGFDQSTNQPGQNVITPGGAAQTPGSVYQFPGQNQGQLQYPGGQVNTEQQGFPSTGAPNNQPIDQYPGQNIMNPGAIVQIPGGNQGLVQYPASQMVTEQPGYVPSTLSPTTLQPNGNQYGVNYDGSQGPISQGTYTGQPINVQNIGEGQLSQTSYPNQELFNVGTIPSQYPNGNQDYDVSGPRRSGNVYQPGSTASTIPSSYYNDVSGTTPRPGVPSSTSAYSSVGPVYRPERPQAAADRNAVILNYENIRTPNGYSYSFDTSNGIHADESGIVDNGTKAQGSYSYIGDDGKVYSVIYTADENGFQPRGDHLPTPPPIPEAIQRVIEQAARDKAAGIVDDGSYDEAKYGDNKYKETANRRQPQNQGTDLIKPIVGIKDIEYDENIAQNQFNNNFPTTGAQKGSSGNSPSIQINSENNVQDVLEGNRKVSGDSDSPIRDFDENGVPITQKGINQVKNYGTKKQGPSGRRPMSNKSTNQNNILGSKNLEPSGLRTDSGSPNISDGSSENTSFDNITGAPTIGNKKQILAQRIKGNQRPTSTSKYAANQPISNQQVTQQDATGYQYQSPNTKFEQNKFPTRFSSQEVSSTMKPDQRRTEFVEGTTRKPFITPNVYNQNDGTNESSGDNQPKTRKPFMTIGVTRPTDNSYTDYDDGEDYATDQDIDDNRISSTKNPAEKSVTSKPYQTTQTKSRPQYNPGGQRTRINQKGTVAPGQKIDYSGTVTPGYSSTLAPSHNSRFGSTEMPRMKPQQRPSITIPDSTTAIGRPITTQSPSVTGPLDYKYQTTAPVSKYPGANVGFGYPTTGSVPGFGSIPTTPGVPTPQDYYTPTYSPFQGYSTTSVSPTFGYIQGSGPHTPSGTLGPLQPSQDGSFHTGYHYGPPKSDYTSTGVFNPDQSGPGFFPSTGNFGVSPTLPTATYQTTYREGPAGFPSTKLVSSTPGRQGTFIPSQPGTSTPSPIGTYQGNYQNGPSTPNYSTAIVSSTPGGSPVFGYPGSPGTQEPTGYEYGPSRPTYSTTGSPSTIGTTPGPYQDYSTTYRPGYQTSKDTFIGGPVVDGFGKPIITEQGSSGPIVGPNFGGTEKSTTYPGAYDQTRVIGEDFTGPKQPQRYDPKTGYHYK